MPAPSEQGSSESDGLIRRRRKKDEKALDSSEKKKRRKVDKEKKRKRKREDAERPQDASSLKVPDEDPTWRLFYSDRRGDMLNIQFGGLHAGDVPRYHLVNGGRSVLGLSSAWVARRNRKGVEIEIRGQRKLLGLTDSGSRALLAAPPTQRLLSAGDVYKYQEVDGYLPLPSRTRDSNQPYRSITQDQAGSDSDLAPESMHESASGDSAEDEPILTSHHEALKSLEQQLSRNPDSVNLWLSLLSQTLSTVPLLSKNATKARAEIALAVLSRAISADPRNLNSKVLRLKFLKAGEEIWQESRMHDEWESALKVGGVEIWMEWLEWRIRRCKKGMESVVEAAVRAMGALGSDIAGELGKVRIFWRTAVAFQNSGYLERGMAMFQAQAELTFKPPRALHSDSFDALLDSLDAFWESETPRVGEPDAKGWGAWIQSGKPQGIASLQVPTSTVPTELDPFRQWAANETSADGASFLPSRSTDERADLDPYSTVLFTDVRPLLFALRTPKARNAFRLAWLSFIGLVVPGFFRSLSGAEGEDLDNCWDDRWSLTHLCKPSFLNALFPEALDVQTARTDAIAGALVGREKEYASGFGPMKNWSYGVLEPLQAAIGRVNETGKRKEKQYTMWQKEDIEGIHEDFVRRVFVQLRLGGGDTEWDVLALAFEAALSVKGAIKVSRQLLSTTQDSLSLWASHAQLERLRGRLDDARKVYHTVLIASSPKKQDGIAQLWWMWAEMEWLASRHEEALSIILRSAGIQGQGEVVILRAKRALDDASGRNIRWQERVAWIRLRALLELLTTADAKVAVGLFNLDVTSEGGVEHESLTIASLLMLYYHSVILQNPMAPTLLRQRAARAIEIYPSNSIILGLFLEGEKGQGVWGHVRANLGESGGRSKNIARRVEEVWISSWERGRWSNEMERTRSGLTAAVEHDRTRASPVIWRIFIEFEIRAKELGRAKKLLYRAIGECPIVKDLYLIAFGPLRSVFSSQELVNFADTMAERGIRMRQGLEEVLDGWTMGRVEGEKDEENNKLDEIEEDAQELRRLMPY